MPLRLFTAPAERTVCPAWSVSVMRSTDTAMATTANRSTIVMVAIWVFTPILVLLMIFKKRPL